MSEALLNPWMAGSFAALVVLAMLTVRALITATVMFRATAWVPVVSRWMSSWISAHHYTA